jgi:hypothetical protein
MILAAATMTCFALSAEPACLSWLNTAEQLRESHPDGVDFFAAFELDARGIAPFQPVTDRLTELGGTWWTYTYDDGRTEVTSGNRFGHICAGRNLIADRAVTAGASHILHLDADMEPPADCLPKLLEMNHPLVGGEVPTYSLRGPYVPGYPYAVQEHMNTAGFLLVARSVFRRLRWRFDLEAGLTDDPCYHLDAKELLGVPTYVRKDVIGRHWPESIPPLEDRYGPGSRALVR